LVDTVRADEQAQIEQGVSYDEARVRLAQVHTREDIILLSAQLTELLTSSDAHLALLRQVRWLFVAVTVLLLWRVL
jgi:hypothetical protein